MKGAIVDGYLLLKDGETVLKVAKVEDDITGKKLITLPDGRYRLFSKDASAKDGVAWAFNAWEETGKVF